MKLRNKKTGEVVPASNMSVGIGDKGRWYESLEELNRDYEDYKEPLIKDEKIRKAVGAWRACNGDDCFYVVDDKRLTDGSGMIIEFNEEPFAELERRHYTITELCGKEENV